MKKHTPIFKHSLFYSLLRMYVGVCFRRYYRIAHIHKKSIPLDAKLIFAPNHQNALMDALAVFQIYREQMVFLARSDIFRNKTIAKMLTFIKILPIYRMRDGYDQMANNAQVFQQTFEVLNSNTPLAILPEGNHGTNKNVRPMKKGIARIAFSYHNEHSDQHDLKIVPVGLHYSNHHEPGSTLTIHTGNPITIADFDSEYKENPAKAANIFLKKLSDELKKVVIHVEDESAYYVCDQLTTMYAALADARNEHPELIFDTQKKIISYTEGVKNANEETYYKIESEIKDVSTILHGQDLSMRDLVFLKKSTSQNIPFFNIAFLVISLPFYLFAAFQNLIPYLLVRGVSQKIKDSQFTSSVLFAGTILFYPLFFFLQTVVFGIVTGNLYWTLAYFISLPISFAIKFRWEKLRKNTQKILSIKKIAEGLQKHLQSIEKLTGFKMG